MYSTFLNYSLFVLPPRDNLSEKPNLYWARINLCLSYVMENPAKSMLNMYVFINYYLLLSMDSSNYDHLLCIPALISRSELLAISLNSYYSSYYFYS